MKKLLLFICAIINVVGYAQEDYAITEMELNQFDSSFQAEVVTKYNFTKNGKTENVIVNISFCDDCNDEMKSSIINIEFQNWNSYSCSKKEARLSKGLTFIQKTVYIIN